MALSLPLFLYVFILGSVLGSYLNSWMWRVSRVGKEALGGRSVCVGCERKLAWYENIPLVSYVALKGKCRTCKITIPLDYFWIEALMGLLFVGLSYYHLQQATIVPERFFRDIFFLTVLMIIFVYDAKYKIILSGLVWIATIVGFVFNLYLGLSTYSLLLGGIVGGSFFLAQYVISKGKWIGGGDVRMGVMMGAWLGWPNISVALFVSYIVGAIVAVPLLLTKKKGLKSEIPFGTFLAVGTMVALLWGSKIVGWYVGLVGF